MKNRGFPVTDIHPDNHIDLRDELNKDSINNLPYPKSEPIAIVMKNYQPEYVPTIKELNTPFYDKIKTNKRNDKSNKRKRR